MLKKAPKKLWACLNCDFPNTPHSQAMEDGESQNCTQIEEAPGCAGTIPPNFAAAYSVRSIWETSLNSTTKSYRRTFPLFLITSLVYDFIIRWYSKYTKSTTPFCQPLDAKQFSPTLFVDVSQAFDRVWLAEPLIKLMKRYRSNMLRLPPPTWTNYGGATSAWWKPIRTGLLQRSQQGRLYGNYRQYVA